MLKKAIALSMLGVFIIQQSVFAVGLSDAQLAPVSGIDSANVHLNDNSMTLDIINSGQTNITWDKLSVGAQ